MRKITFLCALAFLSATAGAETVALSLDEALRGASENNSALKSARITLGVSETEAASAWNAFLPSLSVSGRLSSSHALPNSEATVDAAKATTLSVSAGASLTVQGGVGEALRQKALAKAAARVSYEKAEADLAVQVKKAYYGLVTQERSVAVSEKNLAIAREQEKRVGENYRSGLSSELDYLTAQYTRASLEQDLLNLRQSRANARKSFNILLGLSMDTELSLTDSVPEDIPEIAKPESIGGFVERRYDVIAAYYALEIAKSQRLASTINRYGPTLSVSESVSAQANPPKDLEAPKTGTLTVSVSVPLDGYVPGSAASVAAKKAAGAVEKATLALEDARRAALREIETLFDSADQLRETVRLARFNERIALRKFELSGQGYESGLVTQGSLDEARQNYLSAQLKVLSARNALETGIIDLANALNVEETALYAKEN